MGSLKICVLKHGFSHTWALSNMGYLQNVLSTMGSLKNVFSSMGSLSHVFSQIIHVFSPYAMLNMLHILLSKLALVRSVIFL